MSISSKVKTCINRTAIRNIVRYDFYRSYFGSIKKIGLKEISNIDYYLNIEYNAAGGHIQDRKKPDPSGRKTALLIDRNVPEYDDNAGDRTVFDYLRCLTSLNINVILLPMYYYDSEFSSEIRSAGVEIVQRRTYEDHGLSWISDNGDKLDYVMMFRPEVADFYIREIRKHSNAKIYYNVADLHNLRFKREYELTGVKSLLRKALEQEAKEKELMGLCDICVTVSSYEYNIISGLIGGDRTMIVPMYCYDNPDIGERVVSPDKSLMFVGSFSHKPNCDAISYFINDIWPLIIKSSTDIKLYIIGSKVPKSIREMSTKDIVICGHISDDELNQYYQKCSVSIVPLRYGAGVKGKVIEAMYHKIPIVSTSIGLEGIEDLSEMLKPRDTPEEFADEVVKLISDHDYAKRMSESYLECIKKHYSMESLRELFSREFELGQ